MVKFWRATKRPRYHQFKGGTTPIFVGENRDWPLREATCVRCGHTRQISWFLDPATLDYIGGCA